MLPSEEYSGDSTPNQGFWTPQVWKVGPDALVAMAKKDLYANFFDVGDALAGGNTAPAFSGVSQGHNEGELSVEASRGNGGSRHDEWKQSVEENMIYKDKPWTTTQERQNDWDYPRRDISPDYED